MKEITFKTKGVCARSITFSKDDECMDEEELCKNIIF